MQLIARDTGVYVPGPKHMRPHPSLAYNGAQSSFPAIPMKRDTMMVAPGGYTVMRFRADNPGVWIMHCHMEWHVTAGLTVTMVEAPLQLQKQQSLTPQWLSNCKAQGVPTQGNAAGNTVNHFDLTWANIHVPPLNETGALAP